MYQPINQPIMELLAVEPRSTGELGQLLNIPSEDRQKLYTRLYQLKALGLIELSNCRPTPLSGYNQEQEVDREAESTRSRGGRPKGRSEWWKWALTFQGKEALNKTKSVRP